MILPFFPVCRAATLRIGVVFRATTAIIRTPMKMLLNLFLLVGMSPGTFLPSSITDQLIAPTAPQPKSSSDAAESDDDKNSSRGQDADPSQETSPVLVVPSMYSAIRPTGIQFTKSDFRTILTPVGSHASKFFLLFDFTTASRNGLHSRIMELDFCDAYSATVTSPEICAHAPPTQS